jgi:hypothetical protein
MDRIQKVFDTPVLLIIFNRPENTRRVFEAIRKITPLKLFISADGPRGSRNEESDLCEKTRQIIEEIDWPCEVFRNYSNINIGCDAHIESAVTWFFEHVDYGVVLEDDCIPNISFFIFCKTLLEKYADDTKVMHINGSNFQFGKIRGESSYYFSKYSHSWGWATWKRSWKYYDSKMSAFPAFDQEEKINSILSTQREKNFWLKFFRKLHVGSYPFWDARWTFAIWSRGGVCVTPNVNMISNTGYGTSATHTFTKEKIHQKSEEMDYINHPISSNIDSNADEETFKIYYYRNFIQKLMYRFYKLFA